LLAVVALALIAGEAGAQTDSSATPDPGRLEAVRLRDGSTLVGRVRLSGDSVRIATAFTVVTVPASAVTDRRALAGSAVRAGVYYPPNPNTTRLFFGPTGRMLEKGDGYFSSTYLFFVGAFAGVNDRVTLGGGLSIFPVPDLKDFGENLFYIAPKVGLFNTQTVNVAAGALVGTGGFLNDGGTIGIGYLVGTFGGTEGSVTAGVGFGWAGGKAADDVVLMVGGEKRLSRRTAFVSENYFITAGEDPVVSYGLRFFGERMAVDLAFINTLGRNALFPGVPYVDFVFHF
jgi:hypothetical protein